jgi:V/A-type H+-transporting ATPase subunit I
MALVDMKRLVLIGHRDDKDKILKALTKSRLVEVCGAKDVEYASRDTTELSREKINEKLRRLDAAFLFFKEQTKIAARLQKKGTDEGEKVEFSPVKRPLLPPQKRMGFDEFVESGNKEDEMMAAVAEVEKISARFSEIKSERAKLIAQKEQMRVFTSIDSPFSAFTESKYTSSVLGTVPDEKLAALKQEYPSMDCVHLEFSEAVSGLSAVAAVILKEKFDETMRTLAAFGFNRFNFASDKTAAEIIEEADAALTALKTERLKLLGQAVEYSKLKPELEVLYDLCLVERAKAMANDSFRHTKSAFYMEGWYAAPKEGELQEVLENCGDSFYYHFRDAEAGEIQPTLVKSSKIVEPYQAVTNMYDVPLKGADIDPNPFVAFFYFLYFGMMLGDAAYGAILAIGGFVLYGLMRPAPGKGRVLLVIAMGGVSTLIWGALFGSWFSITLEPDSFLSKIRIVDPLNEPINMLILCYGAGFLHILAALGIKGYQHIKAKEYKAFISGVLGWFLVFIGLGFILGGLLGGIKGLNIAAYAFLGLGVLCIIIFSGSAKNPVKRILGGVLKLYDGVGILSDVLSYSRLFALGIATGVVGMVINKIAFVIKDILTFGDFSVFGWIVAAVILVGGHIFNIVINLLGTYIHDCRLQYIEFFGKFYTGGGHQFIPLGSNTKYFYIEK